jgi:L-threonylcarbamoyladenylate synthase
MPSHGIAKKIIELLGEPLAAPSANLSGRPSPTSLKDALEDLDGKVAAAVDGGACSLGLESTVLSLYGDQPVLLRPGSITKEALEHVLGRPILLPSHDAKIHSPGMKYRHYAPKASIRLVNRIEDLRGPFILSCVEIAGAKKLSGQTFYAHLREADRLGVQEIEVFCEKTLLKDAALMNRLLRAAGQVG